MRLLSDGGAPVVSGESRVGSVNLTVPEQAIRNNGIIASVKGILSPVLLSEILILVDEC